MARLTLSGPQSHFLDNWGQITWNFSSMSPNRDWGYKRVNSFRTPAPFFWGNVAYNLSVFPKLWANAAKRINDLGGFFFSGQNTARGARFSLVLV